MATTSTINTAAPHASSLYDEQLFYAALRQGNPSESRVEALAALAMRHLPKASETWSALRKVLMEQTDLDAAPNRTLWYLVDALIKGAPHVFVPLLAPRLLEYTIQQLPWELAGHRGQTKLWFEALVLSWERVLPPRLYASVRQHAIQFRSGAELHSLLTDTTDDGSPATGAQVRDLRDAFDALRYLGEAAGGRAIFHASESATALNDALSMVTALQAVTQKPTAVSDGASSESEDEDDYAPDYVDGAQPRALPDLHLPKQKKRREARRRPREDDLGM